VKNGKLLEVLRIAVMYTVLEREGNMSASELGKYLGCKRDLVVEYVRAHENLFEISNNGISFKKVFLKPNQKETEDPHHFVLELLGFCEDFCDIPSEDILTKKFLEWFTKRP
jgi:hypothetical protein